jgi:hypothetical protein
MQLQKSAAGAQPSQAGSHLAASLATRETLIETALVPIVQEAIARWAATGLSGAQLALLRATPFQIVDLGASGELGVALPSRIEIDDDAAGQGWFIDPTPHEDRDFALVRRIGVPSYELRATAGSPAFGRADLLTVVMHELGHELDLEDLPVGVAAHDLMTESLGLGTRRLPAAHEAPPLIITPASASSKTREELFAGLASGAGSSNDMSNRHSESGSTYCHSGILGQLRSRRAIPRSQMTV